MASASPAAASARWFNATTGEILDTGWPVDDTNAVPWAQAARAGQEFCGPRGFVGGFLNGHQLGNRRGVICIDANTAQWFNATTGELLDTGYPVGDTNTTPWAHANRAGQEFCGARGFVGGFLNGHQLHNHRGVICVASGARWFDATTGQLLDTGYPVWDTNTTPWAHAYRAAQEFCGPRGFVGGFLNGHQLGNRRGLICLRA
jgi:hypothetical protein